MAKRKPTKKRPVKKAMDRSIKKTGHPTQRRITAELAERAFMRWAEEYKDGSGFAGISREFGFNRDTWRARAKRDDWNKRYQRYLEKSQKKTETDLARRYLLQTKQADGLANSALRSLYEKRPDPENPGQYIMVLVNPATLGETVQVLRYRDDLHDKMPDRADESASTMTEEEVTLFTAAIEMLGTEGLKGMGKLIVEKADQFAKEQEPQE